MPRAAPRATGRATDGLIAPTHQAVARPLHVRFVSPSVTRGRQMVDGLDVRRAPHGRWLRNKPAKNNPAGAGTTLGFSGWLVTTRPSGVGVTVRARRHPLPTCVSEPKTSAPEAPASAIRFRGLPTRRRQGAFAGI